MQFAVLTFVSVAIGGVVEFVPTALIRSNIPSIASVKPYTPLEIEGRDLYIREGCVGCHSQMVRPLRAETVRYGDYSKPGEFVYDHPFLWGSKRTGPDLHRVGGKYPDSWHFVHMRQPSATSPQSIMPGYPWMYDARLEPSHVEGKIITLRRLGVPYPDGYERQAASDLAAQAAKNCRRPQAERLQHECRPRDRRAHRVPAAPGNGYQVVALRRAADRLDAEGCGRGRRPVMYKETLRAIAGIGLFPAVSLVLFVVVFALVLVQVVRMDRTRDRATRRPATRSRRRPSVRAPGGDAMNTTPSGPKRDELLDHEADGIREFDNALPRWWLYGFYFTIAFALVYVVNYHLLPKPMFGQPGMIAEYEAEVLAAEAAAAARGPVRKTAAAAVALTDAASLAKGKAIFEGPENVCSSCHRPDLGGLVGPNLTDDYWLHGCSMPR